MNVFAMEQLMMHQKTEIENQARHTWKWTSFNNAAKAVVQQPVLEVKPVFLQVNPAVACCSVCC
ncbi:hypothetical protein [Cohnella sp. REN36]|uniref:hypothetical protein n=1 Tax=Cohnella sp. REN36 TaxID=2887347 RepID=UPI001D1560CB|nr:hypothetical protein [Cohnella sp. REN36]MCC3373071.1 hypothetical protein [Cohnella sp. REN36]